MGVPPRTGLPLARCAPPDAALAAPPPGRHPHGRGTDGIGNAGGDTESKATSRDLVIVEGINARGFGTVPKAVMRDAALPVEAKGIYAYLCSFAGGGQTAFPSRATMLAELGMSKDRFYKYRQMLIDRGLLRVERRSEGNVAHPVRTNVYVLASALPDCYLRGESASPSASGGAGDVEKEGKAVSPQVRNDVRETRTSSEGFPQPAGHERRPDFKDVVGTRTTSCPGNKDIEGGRPPSSSAENSEPIKNRLKERPIPSVQPGSTLSEIEREFDALASPERTPNRNRIHEALASYGEVRRRFPAAVISAAWDRRQRDARDAMRPSRYFPQLARWLDDPGPDGAARMCEAEQRRAEERAASRLAVALSLDEGYMAMREEARRLEDVARDGPLHAGDAARLEALERSMAAARDAKRAEAAAGAGAR